MYSHYTATKFYINFELNNMFAIKLHIRYDTIVCVPCSKKLTGSQLSLPHGTNKKLKCKTIVIVRQSSR